MQSDTEFALFDSDSYSEYYNWRRGMELRTIESLNLHSHPSEIEEWSKSDGVMEALEQTDEIDDSESVCSTEVLLTFLSRVFGTHSSRMGVRGLSAYISQDPNSFVKYELHNTYLVFDAENYVYHCYRNSGLARQFGGEYMDFAVYVRMFLKQLRRCRITPIFIFDGCHGKQGLKLNTLLKRSRERIVDLRNSIQRSQQISDADDLALITEIAPKLMIAVFLDVLRETGALYTSCEREADVHVAELACFLHCPVVSNDSDFYIFRPNCSSSDPSSSGASSYPYQLISLVSLGQPHRLSGPGCGRCSSSSGCYALPCSMFRPTDCPLGKIYPPLLPVLATLIGNDFISAVQVPPVVSQLISDPKRSTRFPTYARKRIDALVEWLARFGQDTIGPIRAILDLYSPIERESIARHMRETTLDYVVQPWETGRELASRLRLSQSSTDHCSSPVINCSGSPAPSPVSVQTFHSTPQTLNKRSEIALNSARSACDLLNSKLPQLVDLIENVLPKPGRKILSAIHRVEDEKISHGWPDALIEMLQKCDLPASVMNTLYVRTGSVQNIMFEDMLGQSESIYHVLNPLRLLFYNLLFGLELHCHTTQKLCSVQNKLVVEYRRHGDEMLPRSFSLSVLTVPHCDDVHSIRSQSIGFLLTELVVHQINELQLLMLEMKHLVNLVEGLMRNNHTAAGLGRGDASSSSSSVSMPPIGWSNWIHFPSCRLIYWFVSCLQEMRPHSRFHNAVDVWLPRVNQAFRSSGTAVDLNELKRAICSIFQSVSSPARLTR
ncbi:unnamed protein product [Echinostoma caproni]|uniref:XPG_I_2 domain-containing protein n=1 Tax=Echinostoma caproni TaxID=27848 RepID=A0A183APE0_9TREM|nr:unnamed protein product [Echinostoma caproni]